MWWAKVTTAAIRIDMPEVTGDLLVVLQKDEVWAELFGRDGFGRLVEMLSQLADTVPIGLAGTIADGDQFEVIGEGD